MPENVINREDI